MENINTTNNQSRVVDISLAVTSKTKVRIDGDDSRILEINLNDMGIVKRLSDSVPKLQELTKYAVQKLADIELDENVGDVDEQSEEIRGWDGIVAVGTTLDEIDNQMRELIDDIFNSEVAKVCAPDGTMFDMFNGQFRFEIIVEQLSLLFGASVTREANQMSARIHNHVDKYINQG